MANIRHVPEVIFYEGEEDLEYGSVRIGRDAAGAEVGEAALVISPGGVIVSCSDSAATLFGFARGELEGRCWRSLYPETATAPGSADNPGRALSPQGVFTATLDLRRRDDHAFQAHVRAMQMPRTNPSRDRILTRTAAGAADAGRCVGEFRSWGYCAST